MTQKKLRNRTKSSHLINGGIPLEFIASVGIKLIDKHEAADLIGVSWETLKRYRLRKDSTLVRGIHYFALSSRTIKYNSVLLLDWAINKDNPIAHQEAIYKFLAALPSNK